MALRRATFRLYPNKQVSEMLHYHRQLHKDLYNAAVSNRITSYKKFGKKVQKLVSKLSRKVANQRQNFVHQERNYTNN